MATVPASIEMMGWTGVCYRPIPAPLGSTRIDMARRGGHEAASPVVGAFAALVREWLPHRSR